MRSLTKSLVWVFATLLLASCGGGGGGGNGSGFTQAGITVSVSPQSGTSTPFSLVPVVVRATTNNQSLPEGTVVTLTVSPPNVGLVSAVQLDGVNTVVAESVTGQLRGGVANFRLHTRAAGSATLTASVIDPAAPSRTVTGTSIVAVNAGAGTDPRLVLTATASTLPINSQLLIPFIGSPYISELTITRRTLDGALVTGTETCQVAASPVTFGAFSTLDDPETDDVNEIEVLIGSGPVNINAGRGTIFVSSFDRPGQLTISVSCRDLVTNETISNTFVVTIGNGSPQLPASIVISTDDRPVYIQGSNGNTTQPIEVLLFDGGGAPVPDAPAGVNNVRLEIVGGAQGGERLASISASGAPQQGSPVFARTTNGIANAFYTSGTRSGPVVLRATSDRADNNVDNGIQDPVTSTRQIVVSDGRLFDIDIDTSTLQGLSTNVIPIAGDAYRAIVRATATDRFGIPVPPGTQIQWGLIDEPVDGNAFAIAGTTGDPQEGGTLFTDPNGGFTTQGGGAGPNDTLIVFGEDRELQGDRDLESSRTIVSIQSATQLTVAYRFNYNDDTGVSVNHGPVLRYAIGRATNGNISPVSSTNSRGTASALIVYSASDVGKRFIVWARGQGDIVQGTAELVTDAEEVNYPGAGPGTLTARPSSIGANRTVPVAVCLKDANDVGVGNASVAFSFTGGTGTVNGQASGSVTTGGNGCVVVAVSTSGVLTGGPTLEFTFGDLTATVTIRPPGSVVVSVTPSGVVVGPGAGVAVVEVCVRDGGTGISGVSITSTCTIAPPATLAAQGSLPTGLDGCTNVGIQYSGLASNGPDNLPGTADDIVRSGTCTFSTGGTGGGSATATFTGTTVCPPGISPPPPGCP